MSADFLEFHDKDGDPVYVKNDIVAIYTEVDKTEVRSFYGEAIKTAEHNPVRVIISKSSGRWEVTESYREILNEMASLPPCE